MRFCPVEWRAAVSLSTGSDGERVEVVGEDRPAGPGSHPVVALQARAAQAVAALEVADAPLDTGAVARPTLASPARAGLVTPRELALRIGQGGKESFVAPG